MSMVNMSSFLLLKAQTKKYIKRWKGKGGKWYYKYIESTGRRKKKEDIIGKKLLSKEEFKEKALHGKKKSLKAYFQFMKAGKSRVGLVPKKVQVRRKDGRTYTQTVWVRLTDVEGKKNWLTGFMNLFGFKTKDKADTRIRQDFEDNDVQDKFDLSLSDWKGHIADYFLNKDKWAKFFTKGEKEKGKEKGKEKVTITKKDRKITVKRKSNLKLSVMRFIHGLYGGEVKKEDHFDTMPETAKVETQGTPTDEQSKEMQDTETKQSREGYFNEKPSDLLNVGADVWGAARHNFDTYEQFNYDLNEMEKQGTAQAFVNKKNLLGKYGLADKDARVTNGETEYKVLMSYAIRDYLAKVPEGNEKDRQAYFEFCRALIRLDSETTEAKEFITGLAEYAKQSDSLKSEIIGASTFFFLNTVISGKVSAGWMYGLDKVGNRQLQNLSAIFVNETLKDESYNDILKKVLGATKVSGLKIKKGDIIKFAENLREEIYITKTSFDNDEKKNKYNELNNKIREANKHYNNRYAAYRTDKNIKRTELEKFFGQKFQDWEDAETKIINLIKGMFDDRNQHITITKYFPEESGQVIRVGKDNLDISFKFADNDIKTFQVKPDMIQAENIESIVKDVMKRTTSRLNLYIESKVTRKGGKDFDKLTLKEAQKELKDTLGLKAVQYGNSMPVDEGEYHSKWTLGAFHDLSEILNIPLDQISARGKLGVAFGARGKGATGGMRGAIAHYESDMKMINLTRSNGFGSLAHEWGHFMDNILSDKGQGYITTNPGYDKKTISKEEAVPHGAIIEKAQRTRRGRSFGKTDRYYFDSKKSGSYKWVKLNQGQSVPSEKNSNYYNFSFKQYSGVPIPREILIPKDIEYRKVAAEIAEKSLESYDAQISATLESKGDKGSIEYAAVDASSKDVYYRDKKETFARAFEAYVADKLVEKGRKNTYLSSQEKTMSEDGLFAYPQKEYRKDINKMFDKFFSLIRKSNELQKALNRHFGIGDKSVKIQRFQNVSNGTHKTFLLKGKPAEVGEVRSYNGKKMKKIAPGKWQTVSDGKPSPKDEKEKKGVSAKPKPKNGVKGDKTRMNQIKEAIKDALKGFVNVLSDVYTGKGGGEAAMQEGKIQAEHAKQIGVGKKIEKAKYIKRWKGKGEKWYYDYGKDKKVERSKVITPDRNGTQIKIGDLVEHFRFGKGKITNIDTTTYSIPMVTFDSQELGEKIIRSVGEFSKEQS